MGYDKEAWNWPTSQVEALMADHAELYNNCAGLDPKDFKTEFLRWPLLAESMTASDIGQVNWDELAEYYGWDDNVIEMPKRGKTVEEVAAEVISQGVSTVEAVGRVVEAHQEAIELILNTLDDHASRMDRMKRQINTLVEVHGT